jgi:poly-gamma-glutamate synthesis protein (capsule biosynthesis protein)
MKIAFLGDTAFFGKFSTLNDQKDNIFKRFEAVKEVLKNFDFVVANLETPLTECKKTCTGKSAYIKGVPEDVELLKYIGVTHVTLANNHIFDYTGKGFEDTISNLKKAGIKLFGVNGISCIEKIDENEICFHGFCCYSTNARGFAEKNKSYGVNVLDFENTKKVLETDKQNNRLSILSVHWGEEHVNYPNRYHIDFARDLAKEYSFMLHGHHPHVVQGIEQIKDSLIAYSLGNFCFDDVYTKKSSKPLIKLSENNRTTFILSVEVKQNKIVEHKCIPLYIGDEKIEMTDPCKFEKNMQEYSAALNSEKFSYIEKRQKLLSAYLNSRKRMRNLKWYLKRLNLESVKMIYNAKKNSAFFDAHITKKLDREEMPFLSNVALVIGNFDVINQNAAGRRVLGVGKIFKELGYQPVFVGVNKYADDNVLNNYCIKEDMYTYSIKASGSVLSWLRVKKVYKKYLEVISQIGVDNIKYIYAYGSPVLSILLSLILKFAKKHSICMIGDCVDWIEHTVGSKIKNIVKYIDTNYQKRYLYGKTDGMVVISSYLEKYYNSKNKKTLVIPPVSEFKPENSNKKDNGFLNLVYAGIPFANVQNIEKSMMKDRLDKIIETVIELNKMEIKTKLEIYGLLKEEYIYSVPEHAKILDIHDSIIRFNGKVSAKETQKAILGCDATILIRDDTVVTRAGFPTKVAESLCLGIPVITNATSDIANYVISGYNGVIIDSNPKIAATQIKEEFICENKQKVKENCFKNAVFDYKNYVSDFKKFLEELENNKE